MNNPDFDAHHPACPDWLDLLPDAALRVWCDTGVVRDANALACTLPGGDPRDRPVTEAFDPRDHERLARVLAQPASSGVRATLRLAGAAAGAARALVRIGPPAPQGDRAWRLWQIEPVDPTRHAPFHLTIFDSLHDAVLVLDDSLGLLGANRAARELLGAGQDDAPGRPGTNLDALAWRLLDGQGAPLSGPDHPARVALRERRTVVLEGVGLGADDGRRLWVDLRASHVRFLEAGPVEGVVLSMSDVSARRQARVEVAALQADLERRVRERTAELQAKHREMEQFTYSVSHDLKAPLRGLDGYTRLLLQEKADQLDDDGRLYARQIRRSAAQMSQLIDDLLAYSRVERLRPSLVRLPLAPLVHEVLAERAPDLAAPDFELTVAVDGAEVIGERRGLLLVLRNLVDNAIKFTAGRQPRRIAIEAGSVESDAEGHRRRDLRVRDNGIGFDMQFHDRIFDIFQRLHRAEDYAGTGIGLAIVRKATERMHGQVRAESRPGEGACFVVTLDAP
ncbi:MAG: hypothetical protein RL456_300 [Pseudomonadota bacterium]|jgi:signal transduction histidine kinase